MRLEHRRLQPLFKRFELGSYPRPFPASAPMGRPAVVIRLCAAEVNHAVDTAGAAKDATAGHDMNAIHRAGLRRGHVLPIDLGTPQREILMGNVNSLPVV